MSLTRRITRRTTRAMTRTPTIGEAGNIELMVPANWAISGGAGGGSNNPAGTLNLVSGGVQINADQQVNGLESGRTYRLRANVSAAVTLRIGTTQGGNNALQATVAAGPYTVDFVANGATQWFRFQKSTSTGVVDTISLKRP